MARFIGRSRELSLLAEAYRSPRSEFVPIYGRRRVGKSELILRFMADKPGVYYLGQQSSAALQVREFLEQAAGALDLPLLAELRTGGWRQALLTVVSQWTAANPRVKLVLALDEFQWIAAASPDLLAALQQCWDRHWRDAGTVVLLVCGSYLGFMERDVLGAKSPLFGRRTAQIHLRDDDWTDLGECKWGTVRSPAALEAELDRKAERYPNSRGATLGHRYFVRRTPAARRGHDRWYSLDDLYELAGAAS